MLPRCAVFSTKAFNNGNCVFLENHCDFCCLSFKKVLSLLYTHPVLRIGIGIGK
jgi:hypothetical protein